MLCWTVAVVQGSASQLRCSSVSTSCPSKASPSGSREPTSSSTRSATQSMWLRHRHPSMVKQVYIAALQQVRINYQPSFEQRYSSISRGTKEPLQANAESWE